jgi:hypothetical protein
MHARFAAALADQPAPTVILRGGPDQRLAAAIAACDRVLAAAER